MKTQLSLYATLLLASGATAATSVVAADAESRRFGYVDYGVTAVYHSPPEMHLGVDLDAREISSEDVVWNFESCGERCVASRGFTFVLPEELSVGAKWQAGDMEFESQARTTLQILGTSVDVFRIVGTKDGAALPWTYYASCERGLLLYVEPGERTWEAAAYVSTSARGLFAGACRDK